MTFPNITDSYSKPSNGERGSLLLRLNPVVHATEIIFERYHSLILVILGIIFLGVELAEHLRSGYKNQSHFYTEVSLVFLLLSTAYILIRMLLDSLEKRHRAMETLRMKYSMGTVLSSSQDIGDLTIRMIQQANIIIPMAKMDLFVHEKKKGIYWRSLPECSQHLSRAGIDPCQALKLDEGPCQMCLIQQNGQVKSMRACRQAASLKLANGENCFCLSLVQGATTAGLLHIRLPHHITLENQQIALLENTSYEMASSLSLVMEKRTNEEAIIAQKVHKIQLEIARDLHDTVGQNIGYLRLRLDHMADKEQDNPEAALELKQMVDVANESYDLMRGTLAVLQTGCTDDIVPLFMHYAEKVTERSGLSISIHNQGEAGCLQSGSMRQLYFIFREALSNIEKHAQATQVKVHLLWQDDSLQLVITDDGIGFAQESITKGHYGIKFMRGRVESLQGSLSIQSAPGSGTRLAIQIPCNS